jgi:UDP-N-acetylglucosamine acyltransferase
MKEHYPCLPKDGEVVIAKDVQIGHGTKIYPFVEIRSGTVIGKECKIDSRVTITGDAKIGDNVTIRNSCIIARGSEVGDRTFIAPQVMFNNLDSGRNKIGGAKIGKDCFIGTQCVLHHGITICDNVTIGACSFVNRDITEPGVYINRNVWAWKYPFIKTKLVKVK